MSLIVDAELKNLQRDLKITRKAAFAAGTHKNRLTQWRAYFLFCGYFSLEALPASEDTICLYLQFLSRSLTPGSIRNYLSGVKFLHVGTGFVFPSLKSFAIQVTLRGIDRLALHCPSRAPPVTPSLLVSLVKSDVCTYESPVDIAFSCAFLFAFFLFARISNLVPHSPRTFDYRKHLCRKDIKLSSHGLTVLFKWSKTNQTGSRRLHLPLVRNPHSPLCPVAMFQRMCQLIPAPPAFPAFVVPSHPSTLSPVTKAEFVRVFRHRLSVAGVPAAESYRGHSFRRGGANWAFSSGLPGELIQVFGDWSSDAYKSYLEYSMQAKLRVSEGMTQSLPSI